MKARVNKVTIEVRTTPLLSVEADGIVYVTDPNLTVGPELAAVAGPSVHDQTRRIGWCDVGAAVVTDPGRMTNTQKIIHAVGPRWGEGTERAKLANTTWACLNLAEENSLKSVAFPAIAVGALGYPVENCAKTMLGKIIDFTFEDLKRLRTIIIALPDDSTSEIFRKEFELQLEQLRETGEGRVRA